RAHVRRSRGSRQQRVAAARRKRVVPHQRGAGHRVWHLLSLGPEGPIMNTRHLQRHQQHWDWRAAGNFICGGAGAGLVLFVSLHALDEPRALWLIAAGLMLVGAGLLFVWLEIGRPWRAMNVF